MKVIYGIGKVNTTFKNTVLAIGVFDGMHLGHQALIKAAVARAKVLKGQVVVMTFAPHPVHVLRPDKYVPLIISLSHRLRLIKELGVHACVVVRFTKRFAQLLPEKFVKRYIVDHFKSQEIFVGDEFRFGAGRDGSLEFFKKQGVHFGFRVKGFTPIKIDTVLKDFRASSEKIGSTIIRHCILQGQLFEAERLLGRPVTLSGKVIKGDGRGRQIGFATANIQPQNQVLPPMGVYAVHMHVANCMYMGMANIGVRPTFKNDQIVTIEVHLFDFKGRLYGKEICVEFNQKIRSEQRFSSKEALVCQLKKDEMQARRLLMQ